MPERQYSVVEERTICVRVSRSLDADYRRRKVFPELRMTAADRLSCRPSSFVEVSMKVASDAFEDAKIARYDKSVPRYARACYAALHRNLRDDIDWLNRRGTIPDPGFQQAWKEHWTARSASPAQFQKGDLCLIWSPGSPWHNTIAVIEEGFDLCPVLDPDGIYWREQTRDRLNYKWGYRCRTADGCSVFYCAAYLRNPGGEVRHLRLVGDEQHARAPGKFAA